VKQGDRVLIYMPMIAEAAFAMLACARIGALHSVVFGGFASHSLASRIDDAEPTGGRQRRRRQRGGKVVPYKPLLDEAIKLASHKPAKVLMVDRGLAPISAPSGRDEDYAELRASTWTPWCPASGSTPRTRATRSTPAAPPASPRACSATPAATRWRWPPA
jgi:propionyl-CoA synthetase